MKIKNLLAVTALFCFAIFMAACGAPANNAVNTTNAKPADTKPATSATTPADTKPATTSEAPKPDDKKTEVAAGDSVGVPECDDYIKKYEACLTSVAAKAPQAEGPLKTAFAAQRDGFKKAAATPAGKATLAGICKQAVDTAKASTSAYGCAW